MVQAGDGLGFATETFVKRGVTGKVGTQDLYGYIAS
jgi:hypothetical protein